MVQPLIRVRRAWTSDIYLPHPINATKLPDPASLGYHSPIASRHNHPADTGTPDPQ
ncbi:hypothetical protein ACO0K2_00185 [Undibacterium sp. MH2W]|uniref:hypothetical protein n=1 Tax=Undibacterium sp. MH2W TaxID=3413044 RepID=UPI003BEF796E